MTLAPGLKMHDLQRRGGVGLGDEGGDVLFVPRVQPPRLAAAAGGLDLVLQRLQLVGGAAAGEDQVALGGEALGDGRADEVAGADDRDTGVARRHSGLLPLEAAPGGTLSRGLL